MAIALANAAASSSSLLIASAASLFSSSITQSLCSSKVFT